MSGSALCTAFVLAAGLGTRMRPLTDDIPKPMVQLGGRPMVDHVLDRLVAAGVERAVVNVHYKAAALIAHLGNRLSPAVVISDEQEMLLETGGGVVKALPLIGKDPFFIHNSDTVWLEREVNNVARLASAWDSARMDGLLLLARREGSIGYEGRGDFHLGPDGLLSRRGAEEDAAFVFAGASVAHPRMFDDVPEGRFSLNVPWDRAIASRRLYGLVLEGLWMHVGTPDALLEAEKRMAAWMEAGG